MNPPIEPRDDEPIEGELRPHLWRLRARLVTPPEEERVVADLDRLHRAARIHAHQVPDDDEVCLVAEAREQGSARTRVGQVAAALLLVVAIGGGATLGSTSTPEPVRTDAAPQPTGSLTEPGDPTGGGAAGAEVAPDPGGPGAPSEAEGSTTNADGGGEAADQQVGAGAADGNDRAAPEGDAADRGSGRSDPSSNPTSDPPADPGPARQEPEEPTSADDEPGPAAPATSDPEPDDAGSGGAGPQDPPPSSDDGIIAAPDPGELDGFGGERPCPDGSAPDECLMDGEDDAGEEHPVPEQPESPSRPTTPTTE